MDSHKFEVGDKVMVNVPQLSVPMYNVPATVSDIQSDYLKGAGGRLYTLIDDAGEYLGIFHPAWLTLADGDPWNPVMRTEQEVREALGRTDNSIVTDVLRWVLGELPEFPGGL